MMSSDRLGVAYEPQHGTAYVKGWVEVLKDDPKEIHKAAAEAGRISTMSAKRPSAPERRPLARPGMHPPQRARSRSAAGRCPLRWPRAKCNRRQPLR